MTLTKAAAAVNWSMPFDSWTCHRVRVWWGFKWKDYWERSWRQAATSAECEACTTDEPLLETWHSIIVVSLNYDRSDVSLSHLPPPHPRKRFQTHESAQLVAPSSDLRCSAHIGHGQIAVDIFRTYLCAAKVVSVHCSGVAQMPADLLILGNWFLFCGHSHGGLLLSCEPG